MEVSLRGWLRCELNSTNQTVNFKAEVQNKAGVGTLAGALLREVDNLRMNTFFD